MHRVLLVGVFVALAVVLNGCGSGTAAGKACVNSEFQIVSQSFTAATTGTVEVQFSNKSAPILPPMPSMDSTSKLKIDVDNMNLYEESSQKSPNMSIDLHLVFDAAKKQVVQKHHVTITLPSGVKTELRNCTVMTIPTLPKPSVLAQCFKEVTSMLSKLMKCTGNDGTYDTWEMDMKMPDPSSPLPLPPGFNEDMQYSVLVSKDYLLHSSNMKMNAQMETKFGPMTENIDMGMKVDGGVAAAGGPSAADLDISSWGLCYDVPFKIPDIHPHMPVTQIGFEPHIHGMGPSQHFRLAMQAIEHCSLGPPGDEAVIV